MLVAFLAGSAFATILLVVLRRWRPTTRMVDLISFLLAGVGLLASLIAIGNFERRLDDAAQLSKLTAGSLEAVKKIRTLIDDNCPLTEAQIQQFSQAEPRAVECSRLYDYLQSLDSLEHTRGVMLPTPPSVLLFQSAEPMIAQLQISYCQQIQHRSH
jgi:hypothetical protein